MKDRCIFITVLTLFIADMTPRPNHSILVKITFKDTAGNCTKEAAVNVKAYLTTRHPQSHFNIIICSIRD